MGLQRSQDLADRRAAPRRRVMWGSWLVTPDGSHCVQCQTRDFSATGARVALDDAARLYRPGLLSGYAPPPGL